MAKRCEIVPPSDTNTSVRNKEPNVLEETLVDYEAELFNLTTSKINRTAHPLLDAKRKPVKRMLVWDNGNSIDNSTITPDLRHRISECNDCETLKTDKLRTFSELHRELNATNARLDRVKRGLSLFKLLDKEPVMYKTIDPSRRFGPVNDLVGSSSTEIKAPSTSRKIEFIYPVTSRPTERVNLVSKISNADTKRIKLQKLIQANQKQDIQHHNEIINYLNHRNQRLMRASQSFYEDISNGDLQRAHLNAQRASQRSRLRIINSNKIEWWDAFINFAFTEAVGREEERFIERISRKPKMTVREYYELLKELESKPELSKRNIELLKWLNKQNHYADDEIIEILRYDEQRSARRMFVRKDV